MEGSYDRILVALSVAISLLASFAALSLVSRVAGSRRSVAWLWTAVGALAMGTGIWAMHFVGMLSFSLPIALGYLAGLTWLSWFIAVAVSGFALWLASGERLSNAKLLCGGVVLGAGICAMHYTGMAALDMAPVIRYAPALVLLSVGIALAASWAALWIAFQLRHRRSVRVLGYRAGAALLMGLAISGMHYTGMAAARFSAGSVCLSASSLDASWLAWTVGTTALGLLVLILGVAYVQDVRMVRRQQQAMLLESRRAEEAVRLKTEMLASVSHEIRTPMNAIIGLTYLCLQTELDAKQRDYVVKVHRAARNLLGVVNDILDSSKIESGRLSLEQVSFDLHACVESVASIVGHLAREKGLQFETVTQADVPRYLRGDSLRLSQVLQNLSGNAVKFTPRGSVKILTSLVDAGDAGRATLRFEVADTGIGMSPEELQLLFGSFQQANASISRVFGGTGLGLFISRRLAELMGGGIEVRSQPGRGTSFVLTLPFERGEPVGAVEAVGATLESVRASVHGTRVLLAEDNPFNQQVARELLERLGIEVEVASNGAEAIRLLGDRPFDLVLMDVQMPEVDGYEATRRIRARPAWAELPVVAMTANAMEEDRRRCAAAGMSDYIAKPVNPDQLDRLLVKWLSKPAVPAAETVAAPVHATAARSAIDIEKLKTYAGDDAAKLSRLAFHFVDTVRASMEDVRTAQTGRDLTALGKVGHKLKSSAQAFGADRLAEIFLTLEQAGALQDWELVEPSLRELPGAVEHVELQVARRFGVRNFESLAVERVAESEAPDALLPGPF